MLKMQFKTRLFLYQASTLLLMFLLVLVAYNILGKNFIARQAQNDLRHATLAVENMIYQSSYTIVFPGQGAVSVPLNSIQQIISRNRYIFQEDNIFLVSPGGEFYAVSNNEEEVRPIVEGLLAGYLGARENPFPLTIGERAYYLSILSLPTDTIEPWYGVIYTDMSVLTELFRRQRVLLATALGICLVFVVVISYGLSSWLASPVNRLRQFARAIGDGDFTEKTFHIEDTDMGLLAEDMNLMARQLAKQNEEQKLFFQNVSHDLRTPLMSIQGYAEGIQCGVFDEPSTPAAIILEESHRLYGMVDNLLYISKLDVSEIRPNTVVDIREPLSRSVEKMQGMAIMDGKELRCEFVDEELTVCIDEESLSRALQNLLSNALRYAVSQVTVRCERYEAFCSAEQHGVKISVSDDGQGFAPEDMPHLFERFYKGGGGKYGLGMSIAKSAAESHGGRITAFNAPDGGAVVELLIPLFSLS